MLPTAKISAMRSNYQFYVYILASATGVLYVGITNNLERRIGEHKCGVIPGFTKRYNVNKLVYYECFTDIRYAIQREKVLKGWRRIRKLELVWTVNPQMLDWSEEWDTLATTP